MQSKECKDLMDKFIREKPEIWYAEKSKVLHTRDANRKNLIIGTRILGKKKGFIQRSQSDRTATYSHTGSVGNGPFSLIVLFQLQAGPSAPSQPMNLFKVEPQVFRINFWCDA